MSKPSSGGNGCLYVLLGIGVLLVGGGIALEALPDDLLVAEEYVAPPPVYVPPPPPQPTYEPPPPPQPVAPPLPVADEATRTLLWHVEARGEPPVPCVLQVEATAESRVPQGALRLDCADGRRFAGNLSNGRLMGARLARGVAFRAVLPTVSGSDEQGIIATVHVDTHRHEILIEGATTLAGRHFVEELSVPDRLTSIGLPPARVGAREVRLAVPTIVSGQVPVAIAMVRGTGPEPRAGEPVCELIASPTIDSGYNCRVVLRCHGDTIYGADTSGYNDCQLDGDALVGAVDDGNTAENSDPRLDFDLNQRRLTVSDDPPSGSWSASFDLLVDPRLGADLEYAGGYRGEGSGSWSLRPFGTPAAMTFDGETSTVSATGGQFHSGQYAIATDGTPGLPFEFGRAARSVAGYANDRAVWGFAAGR